MIEEWKRNKETAYDYVKKLKKKLAEFDNQVKYYSKYSDDLSSYEKIKEDFTQGVKKEILRNENHISDVEKFLKEECTLIKISDNIKKLVFDLSISRKAPFHNKKNNIADAAILLSSYEYIKEISNYEALSAIFVSNNYEDFAESKGLEEFHPEIKKLIGDDTILYKRNLPTALSLSKEIINEIEELYKYQQWLESVSFACMSSFCFRNEDFTPWGYLDDEIIIKYKSQQYKYDPNQLELFPDLPKIEIKEKRTPCGKCVVCDTFHIICPVCGELICNQYSEDEDFICEFCEAKFHFEYNDSTKILIVDDVEEKENEEDEE